MKRNKNSGRLVRNILLGALLAVLCVGGTELAACHHFAPDTYERIVAPVRHAASVAADTAAAAMEAAGRFCRSVAAKTAGLAAQAAHQVSAFAGSVAAAWEDFTSGPEEIILIPEEESHPPKESRPPEESNPPVHVTDPPFTQLVEQDGRQILTGGITNLVYFCQSDEEWAEQLYGTDPIGPYGCGPTAMAIVVASLTDVDTDPAKMAAWAVEHGYWARRSGSSHGIILGTAEGFGLTGAPITDRCVEEIRAQLSSGHLVVALVGKGHFTSGGHFIVLRGMTLTGEVLVADPNSLDNSLTAWDPQLILDELSSARDHGAPLWSIAVPTTS